MLYKSYIFILFSDVSDMVLIEPLVETLFAHDEGLWAHHWFAHVLPSYQTMQFAAATGLTRIGLMLGWLETPLQKEDMEEIHMRQVGIG